jgi:hypothetical protein
MSVFRKGTGIGYSIAGSAVNGISLLIGVVFMTMFAGAVASVDQTMKQLEAERNKQKTQATPTNSSIPGTSEQNAPGVPSEPAIIWHSADQPLTLGDVTLRITETRIGKVPLKRMFGDQDSESQDELLTIRIQVTNGSKNKKLDYRGWMADFASMSGITAKLTDENENNYRMIDFSSSVTVQGAKPSESIYPEKTHDDAIVFELPIENAQRLFLKLSGKGCGQDGEYLFEIPHTMLNR